MKIFPKTITWLPALVFAVIFLALVPGRLRESPALTFSSDASHYHNGALHLLHNGMYSVDGVVPFTDREPGQSVFLAFVYAVAGDGNRLAIYLTQSLLYLGILLLFSKNVKKLTNARVAQIFIWIGVLFPAVWCVLLFPNREALALVLSMLSVITLIRYYHRPSYRAACLVGLVLAALILTYIPLLLLPAVFVSAWLFWRLPWRHAPVMLVCAWLPIGLWGVRNSQVLDQFCLARCTTQAVVWHVRGVQAEEVTGLEPLKCLWAEYVSRSWVGRSPACSFNAVKNRQWPNGTHSDPAADLQVAKAGQAKIKAHLVSYLWFSVVDVLEIHLPFVNGWGHTYNLLAALGSGLVYIGILIAGLGLLVRRIPWQAGFWLFLLIPGYLVVFFALTDGTPRYLLPVIFCYFFGAALGYDVLISLQLWKQLVSSFRRITKKKA
jgi:hypothetical protein